MLVGTTRVDETQKHLLIVGADLCIMLRLCGLSSVTRFRCIELNQNVPFAAKSHVCRIWM